MHLTRLNTTIWNSERHVLYGEEPKNSKHEIESAQYKDLPNGEGFTEESSSRRSHSGGSG